MPADVCLQLSESPENASLVELLEGVGDELLAACEASERELSILLTDDQGIQRLNARWRGLDEPTDVLSFAFDEVPNKADWMPLGDVVLNIDRANLQCKDHDLTLEQELIYLLIHGVCHLRGFDHADPQESGVMKEEEERLLKLIEFDVSRPVNFF